MKKREVIARYILTIFNDGSIHKEEIINDEVKEYIAYGQITESWDRMYSILFSSLRSKQFIRVMEAYRDKVVKLEYKGEIYKLNYSKQLPRFTRARKLIESMKSHGEYKVGSTIRYELDSENEIIHLTIEK